MFEQIRSKLTYANVMATTAVFIALGGGAYAAATLPFNSVGTNQLKRGAVTNTKLARDAVTSSKVKDGSLLKADFAAGQLPTGAQGPKGDTGAKGADFTADTTLASGKTLTGSWAVGGGASDWASDSVQFRIPLAAAPAGSDYIPNAAARTANCPGPGQAARGRLCVYRVEGTGSAAFSSIYNNDDGGSNDGASRNGFLIFFETSANFTYASGSWSVTAP
jgi:hypothetical protein